MPPPAAGTWDRSELKEQPPSLTLLDLHLPDSRGAGATITDQQRDRISPGGRRFRFGNDAPLGVHSLCLPSHFASPRYLILAARPSFDPERHREPQSNFRIGDVAHCWNPGAQAMYGYSAEEMIGRSVTVLIPPERRDDFQAIMGRTRHGEQVRHYESVRLRKDGTPVQISLSVSPIKDESGRIVGPSTIARDITERNQAEHKLREASRYTRCARSGFEFLGLTAGERQQIAGVVGNC